MAETTTPTRETLGRYMVVELAPAQPPSGKTKRWLIRSQSGGDVLGVVSWYGSWRAYTLEPVSDRRIVFSADCLEEIVRFLKRVNAEHKGKRG